MSIADFVHSAKILAHTTTSSSSNLSKLTDMNYRAPVVINDNLDSDVCDLFTDAQWKWFAIESCRQSKSVRELLLEMQPMAEQINSDSHEVFLFGILPNCGMYGSIDPTGQSHT